MAVGEPIKFRCGRCKQLIGVARSKAGTVVSCPKCDASLVAPAADEPRPAAPATVEEQLPAEATEGDVASEPEPGLPFEVAPPDERPDDALPLETLAIQIEDIQVEPGVRELYPAQRPPRPYRPAPPRPESELRAAPRPPASRSATTQGAVSAPPTPIEQPDIPPDLSQIPTPTPQVEVPNLTIETSVSEGRRARLPEPSRSRDIVLPRSVVASWSFLVLLAVSFAFVAGLLAGHYLWRVH
ncbi:MAG: hypothetical protein U0794_07660 [Isosphaeraceae bacterium]